MLGRTYDGEVCSIARSLEIVGERWSLLIIRNALFAGATRFGDFQRRLGIASNVLAARLDRFVAEGLMERAESAGSVEYLLTEKGRDLEGVLIALTDWGDRWAAPHGRPIIYRHEGCEGEVHTRVACELCGQRPAETIATPGPGMPPERWAR